MASTAQYKCLRCQSVFQARTADRARGWARYCSKSCKAVVQEQRTGQYAQLRDSEEAEGQSTVFQGGFGEWEDHKNEKF